MKHHSLNKQKRTAKQYIYTHTIYALGSIINTNIYPHATHTCHLHAAEPHQAENITGMRLKGTGGERAVARTIEREFSYDLHLLAPLFSSNQSL